MEDLIVTIHIEFTDGSAPVVYFGKPIDQAVDILKGWSMHWTLRPKPNCLLDGIWYFTARARDDNGLSWVEYKDIVYKYLLNEYGGFAML